MEIEANTYWVSNTLHPESSFESNDVLRASSP